MASSLEEAAGLPMEAVRQKLDLLIQAAPKQVKGRPPTQEEIEEQQNFKAEIKKVLQDVPPESGLSYKAVMKQIRALQNPKQPRNTNNVPTQNDKPKQNKCKKRQPNPKEQNEPDDDTPPIDYLCVLDFEATCDNVGPTPEPQEIIEFPTLLVDAKTGKVVDTFHHYIKPDVHPILSPFCTELTGITQGMVDAGVTLEEALILHQQWLDKHNLISEGTDPFRQAVDKKRFLYVTCGDWDLKTCLPQQLNHHGKEAPDGFRAWINQKYAFTKVYHQSVRGMTNMLGKLELELEGRHHSGIDDCKNIARICQKMLAAGWVPRATRGAKNAGGKAYWKFYKEHDWPATAGSPNKPFKKVYLIRHGQSLGQATTIGDRKTNPALRDCGLSEKGKREAQGVPGLFGRELHESIELVVSSPLTRALGTAVLAFPKHDILVDYDLAEIGNNLPENEARPADEVLEDLHVDAATCKQEGRNIDAESLKPEGWPNPTRTEKQAVRIRDALKALYNREETTIAIICHYKVIKEMIVGKKGNMAPENAVPIKCALFEDGELKLVHSV